MKIKILLKVTFTREKDYWETFSIQTNMPLENSTIRPEDIRSFTKQELQNAAKKIKDKKTRRDKSGKVHDGSSRS